MSDHLDQTLDSFQDRAAQAEQRVQQNLMEVFSVAASTSREHIQRVHHDLLEQIAWKAPNQPDLELAADALAVLDRLVQINRLSSALDDGADLLQADIIEMERIRDSAGSN